MKLIFAGDTGLYGPNDYKYFIYNCNRNKCQEKYTVPMPDLSKLQFFVFFGSKKPSTVQFEVVSTCSNEIGATVTNDYIIGQLPNSKWYGVFKNFTIPVEFDPKCFVITVVFTFEDDSEIRYFSEEICINDCGELMEIKACFPEKATQIGFDLNKIYYGFHNGDPADILGDIAVRYFHKYYVRLGYIINTAKKTTFRGYLSRNFRTEVQYLHELRCELVPEFYSDYLMAAASRGEITVRETMSMAAKKWKLSETNFELVDEDAKLWKPVITLEEIFKGYFGCDECLNGEQACLGNPTGVLAVVPSLGAYVFFTLLGGTALQPGESIQYEIRNKTTGLMVQSGTEIALSWQVPKADWDPDNICYTVRWRKACVTDLGSFSLDYSDDFEVGAGAGAFSEWIQVERGNCATTPAVNNCKKYVIEPFGSDGDTYSIEATLCDGSAYAVSGLLVGDGAPPPICAKEGTVTVGGNAAIADSSEDCTIETSCFNYKIEAPGDTGGGVSFTQCDGSAGGPIAMDAADIIHVCARQGSIMTSDPGFIVTRLEPCAG